MYKLHVVGGSRHEAEANAEWTGMDLVPTIERSDVILFRGGNDIDSRLYGEPSHRFAQRYIRERDAFEVNAFRIAKANGKKMIGSCRGAQLLCAMAGGKLVQDQPSTGYHDISILSDPTKGAPDTVSTVGVECTSCHHQAQFPWTIPDSEFRVLGWTKGMLRYHQDGRGNEMINQLGLPEVEICVYYAIKALGIQGHPEWAGSRSKEGQYMRQLVERFMEDKL